MNKFIKLFTNPIWAISVFIVRNPRILKNDETFIKWGYYHALHKWPNLKCPQSFSEKLNWLKIHAKNPLYSQLVDKYAVKEWVEKQNTGVGIIPTIGVWDKFEEIDFNKLPKQFVLKCTHDSGGLVICKNKDKLDIEWTRRKIESSLKSDFFLKNREYPYKDIKRCIIAENFMQNDDDSELKDYKFFCFDGKPYYCQVISDRSIDEKVDFYDMNWERVEGLVGLSKNIHNSDIKILPPKSFDKMKDIVSRLSKGFPFVRVDLYEIAEMPYFGEMTFFPAAGFGEFRPDYWNQRFGDILKLPNS